MKDGLRGNRIYIIVAIFIIIVIVLAVLFSGAGLFSAYIPYNVREGWIEDHTEHDSGSHLFGLESWNSYTYKNNNTSYPAYVTVTTMKHIFMMNENELKDKTRETIIEKASKQNIIIDKKTEISGERYLSNKHSTMYIIFNGTDDSLENYTEQVKFIGESWNCDKSSTSIICIGFAQITDNANNNSEINLKYWAKIIADNDGGIAQIYRNSNFFKNFFDQNGLIFNVKCH